MSSQGTGQVSVKEARDMHHLLLADSSFFWEGGRDGCFARAVLMVARMEPEGVPWSAIGKLLVIHKHAPLGGWSVQLRLGGVQTWSQHLVPTLATEAGIHVIDPTLCHTVEEERVWLLRFPPERLNPAIAPPSPQFLRSLLRASDAAFRQLLALAATQRPVYFKHLLSNPLVAPRLEQMGEPVRHWLERVGPVPEMFDPHLANLAASAEAFGPLVRGEIVRVSWGVNFFLDVFWDTAGRSGLRGLMDVEQELTRLRLKTQP